MRSLYLLLLDIAGAWIAFRDRKPMVRGHDARGDAAADRMGEVIR